MKIPWDFEKGFQNIDSFCIQKILGSRCSDYRIIGVTIKTTAQSTKINN
jgi:hypothetical protein